MSVHVEEYDDIVSRINRKYQDSLRRGDEMENCDGISTGSLELDVAMGGKGIPIGRITRFYGSYSSSKTLNSYNIIREAQKLGLSCAYYNAEKQYSPDFVEARGVNSSELTVVEGTTIEEIGDKMEALLGVVHVHILDSCSVAVSEDELEADIRDWRPGITARAWGKVFRRINERFDRDNTILLIDQVRTDFKTGGENPAGGRVLDHQSSMTVHFKKGGWLFRNPEGYLDEKAKQVKGMSGQMEPAGIEIKARIVKSRVCRPFRTATMRLDLDTLNFDRTFELVKAAKHYKLVEQRGAYFYIDGEQIAQGDKQLRAYIESNPEFAERISATAIRAVDS